MKKFLGTAFFIFAMLNCSNATSIEYETSSPYWSTSKIGPTSMRQAIEMFFKDRKLDPLEGVWTASNWGLVAIVKDGEIYKGYDISVGHSGLNGTHGRTYLKTASPDVFTFFTRISWKDGSWYVFKTSTGTLILKNNNFAEDNIDQYAKYPHGTLIRNWPTNLNAHNNKIKSESTVKWKKISESKDGTITAYVDAQSMKKKHDRVFFTQLDSLKKAIEIEERSAYSAIQKLEGNCAKKEMRFLMSVYYSEDMAKGNIILTDDSVSDWDYFDSNSVLGIVLEHVCSKAKPKDFQEENVQSDSLEEESEDDWF